MSLEIKVKRGEESWNYFVLIFGIISALLISVVSLVELYRITKIILVTVVIVLSFYCCFINNWYRNKIVGIMTKLKDKPEKYKIN